MNSSPPQPRPGNRDGSPELSIIIPAFNEERRLPKTLEHICQYLRRHHDTGDEVLLDDDGSNDDTAKVVDASKNGFPQLRLLSNGQNRGKGFSVRHGMLKARGEFALFTDADLSTPIEELEKLLAVLRDGYDVAIGSRAVDRKLIEVHQSAFREQAGIIFNGFVRYVTGLPFQDTQCGFKAFRSEKVFAGDLKTLKNAIKQGACTVSTSEAGSRVHSGGGLSTKDIGSTSARRSVQILEQHNRRGLPNVSSL